MSPAVVAMMLTGAGALAALLWKREVRRRACRGTSEPIGHARANRPGAACASTPRNGRTTQPQRAEQLPTTEIREETSSRCRSRSVLCARRSLAALSGRSADSVTNYRRVAMRGPRRLPRLQAIRRPLRRVRGLSRACRGLGRRCAARLPRCSGSRYVALEPGSGRRRSSRADGCGS